jgi:hypothetical protein
MHPGAASRRGLDLAYAGGAPRSPAGITESPAPPRPRSEPSQTDRVAASHHELSGSTRGGWRITTQQLGAELTHAAIGACVPTSCAPRAAPRQSTTH